MTDKNVILNEPYRLFFPLGILLLLWGALLWVPMIWNPENYPVVLHRYLMINGFAGCFISGFLMTAIPKFSRTMTATKTEILAFMFVTAGGLAFAYRGQENLVFFFSSLQPLTIFIFMLSRILRRQENPPYTFIFIFVGLLLWFLSALGSIFFDAEVFKQLHYEGAIASIILGVGSRLIPGILGHVDIVKAQRKIYEPPNPLLKTVPLHFFLMIAGFVASYLVPHPWGQSIRALIVSIVAFSYWRIGKLPKERTALTWSLWVSGWMIVLSFILQALFEDGLIHLGHSFFITGIVLLSLLVATRVLQSHGPRDKTLEDLKTLHFVTGFILLAAVVRVSAYFMPESYSSHLAYSSLLLVAGVSVWSYRYLRYVTFR